VGERAKRVDRVFLVGRFKIGWVPDYTNKRIHMQVLKFLLGIILVQIITALLISLSPITLSDTISLIRLAIPLFFMALMVAFWFSSLSSHERKDLEYKIKDEFAKEREKLKVNAERAKTRVIKEAEKKIAKEATVTHAKANFKVGAAFAGV